MTATDSAQPPLKALRDWTRERVAFYLECPVRDIDTSKPLTAYGFDSVFALAICGDIEDEYGFEVDPTLAWDYPTVDALAGHLAEVLLAHAGQHRGG